MYNIRDLSDSISALYSNNHTLFLPVGYVSFEQTQLHYLGALMLTQDTYVYLLESWLYLHVCKYRELIEKIDIFVVTVQSTDM